LFTFHVDWSAIKLKPFEIGTDWSPYSKKANETSFNTPTVATTWVRVRVGVVVGGGVFRYGRVVYT